jgi:hypothetical protein
MGQIIAFPAIPVPYPDLAAELGGADCVLLLSIRRWVEDYRAGADPIPRLCEALANTGAGDAAFVIDALMTVVARTGRRPVAINCPLCPHVSFDEKQLLHAASLTQASDGKLAEKALRTALLSAEGAAFAVGELEGLANLFAKARLFFARRTSPPSDDGRDAWSPPTALH